VTLLDRIRRRQGGRPRSHRPVCDAQLHAVLHPPTTRAARLQNEAQRDRAATNEVQVQRWLARSNARHRIQQQLWPARVLWRHRRRHQRGVQDGERGLSTAR